MPKKIEQWKQFCPENVIRKRVVKVKTEWEIWLYCSECKETFEKVSYESLGEVKSLRTDGGGYPRN